ncbi:hypothetical protein OKW21_003142 [Catalinimonas alkaloidigena]|uniref:hypothetical protein n=1 Tax=Catalinimonas alkaloidigena TaxID=1075417 RepID=UPI002404F781|nr:hypothetical protein [Catalinimonas alkaloidigena]MDF9797879.1 hypothetical protein [Catalinimonas alkaloidigena]
MKYRTSVRQLMLLVCLFSGGGIAPLIAQEESMKEQKKWSLHGYVKDMVSIMQIDGLENTMVDNLVHNRLNFKWFPAPSLNAYLEIRNRMFFGDLVNTLPNYSELIDINNDYLDLSAIVVDREKWVIHTMIDRAYLEWYKNEWEVRVGRQRINWGKNLVWNPNDLFNAYSFFDFDYEERPGSDALRIKRYTGFASSVEIATTFHEDFDQMVIAGLWQLNRWNYDIQLLGGKSREDIALGLGWAGNLKDAGFKGEVSYFHPYTTSHLSPALLASLSADYSFESSLYFHLSALLNTDGNMHPDDFLFFSFTRGKLTARDLSPYRYSLFMQSTYSFHPLLSGGLASIYFPGDHATYWNPMVSLSLSSNWEVDMIGQLFFTTENKQYHALAKSLFIRLRWSF